MLNVLRNGGFDQILKMLGALHGLMQSEAVSALAITTALVLLEQEEKAKCMESQNAGGEEVSEEQKKTEVASANHVKKDGNFEIKLGQNMCHSDVVSDVDDRFRNLNLCDYDTVLVDGGLGEKLTHLIQQHGAKMDEHILENIFTLFEIVIKFGK